MLDITATTTSATTTTTNRITSSPAINTSTTTAIVVIITTYTPTNASIITTAIAIIMVKIKSSTYFMSVNATFGRVMGLAAEQVLQHWYPVPRANGRVCLDICEQAL
uniref:Uncharacterized protein n=1 Tax=Schistocephalus solidus TaxID=70667 RepID=A0A0X3NQJ7_SCHSO